MTDKSLSDIIRNHLSGIEDPMQLANPVEKANQIEMIAQKHEANRASVSSIFNRELKQIIKKEDMNVSDFFPQRQAKRYSSDLDITIKPKPVDDELPKTNVKLSENVQDSPVDVPPKTNEESEIVTDEDYSNIVTVVDSTISSLFQDVEESTEKEKETLVASFKLLFGNSAKIKPFAGLVGTSVILKKKITKARRIAKEKEQAKKITWNTEI